MIKILINYFHQKIESLQNSTLAIKGAIREERRRNKFITGYIWSHFSKDFGIENYLFLIKCVKANPPNTFLL